MTDTLIIGGGPAGLGAAIALEDDALLLESSSHLGGMSSSISMAGAIFDLGGHSFSTPHPKVRNLVFNALDMFEQPRNAQCFHQGDWIPYPFQRHFNKLSCAQTVLDCARSLPETVNCDNAANLEEYITQRFGAGIAAHFMLPYNRKLWGKNLKRLDTEWTRERIASTNSTDQKFSQSGGKRLPLQTGTVVAYPAKGGFGEIFKALARRIKSYQTNVKIERIDPSKRIAYSASGLRYKYRQAISSLPLPQLLNIIDGVPKEILNSMRFLEAIDLHLVLLTIGNRVDTDIQRVYCAENSVPVHKTAIVHNSSDYLRSLPVHGVVAEVSGSQAGTSTQAELERATVNSLLQMNIIRSADQIVAARTIHCQRAYPVPTHGCQKVVSKAKQWLEENNIYTVGRFGEWAYINSDEALRRGLDAGHALQDYQE